MPTPPFRPLVTGIARPVPGPVPLPIAPAALGTRPIGELVAELHQVRAGVNRSVHRLGVILRELSRPERLAEAGVTDFDAMLGRFDLPPRLSAMKYIAVADHFTEEEAAQVGIERGYAIVRGAAALPEPVAPSVLLAQNPTIKAAGVSRPLAVAPVKAVLEWANALRARVSATPPPTKRMYAEADSVRDKLHRRFASAGIAESKMRVVKRAGAYVVRVELSPEQAAALVRLVRAAK